MSVDHDTPKKSHLFASPPASRYAESVNSCSIDTYHMYIYQWICIVCISIYPFVYISICICYEYIHRYTHTHTHTHSGCETSRYVSPENAARVLYARAQSGQSPLLPAVYYQRFKAKSEAQTSSPRRNPRILTRLPVHHPPSSPDVGTSHDM